VVTSGGVTVTVVANTVNSGDKVAYRPAGIAGQGGLGVYRGIGDVGEFNSTVATSGREMLTFTFSQAVKLDSIGFYLFENNIDQAQLKYGASTLTINSVNGWPVGDYLVSGTPLISSFSVAATGGVTSFRIEGLSVETVPVPGAVWLMGSGLAALGGIARRRVNA
jgi:hypothetical protein